MGLGKPVEQKNGPQIDPRSIQKGIEITMPQKKWRQRAPAGTVQFVPPLAEKFRVSGALRMGGGGETRVALTRQETPKGVGGLIRTRVNEEIIGNGPRKWEMASFPFQTLGSHLARQLDLRPPAFATTVEFLIRDSPSEVTCSNYTASHKLRNFILCEGMSRGAEDTWCGGNDMSAHNKDLWKLLGEPSASDFDKLICRCLPSLERGYYLCFVGDVVGGYQERLNDEVFYQQLLDLPCEPNQWHSPNISLEISLARADKRQAGEVHHEEALPRGDDDEVVEEEDRQEPNASGKGDNDEEQVLPREDDDAEEQEEMGAQPSECDETSLAPPQLVPPREILRSSRLLDWDEL